MGKDVPGPPLYFRGALKNFQSCWFPLTQFRPYTVYHVEFVIYRNTRIPWSFGDVPFGDGDGAVSHKCRLSKTQQLLSLTRTTEVGQHSHRLVEARYYEYDVDSEAKMVQVPAVGLHSHDFQF